MFRTKNWEVFIKKLYNIFDVDFCFIDGICYNDGQTHIYKDCQVCRPNVSRTNWTLENGNNFLLLYFPIYDCKTLSNRLKIKYLALWYTSQWLAVLIVSICMSKFETCWDSLLLKKFIRLNFKQWSHRINNLIKLNVLLAESKFK